MTYEKFKSYSFKRVILNTLFLFISIAVSIIIYSNNQNPGYNYLFLLPIVYSICFISVYSKIIFGEFRIFYFIYIAVSIARYCILPLMIVLSGHYGGRSIIPPTYDSFNRAILLMLYELIVTTFFIFYMEKRYGFDVTYENNPTAKRREIEFTANTSNVIYLLFGLCIIGLIIINPGILRKIHFLSPSANSYNSNNILDSFAVYSFNLFKQLCFTILVYKLSESYKIKGNFSIIWMAGLLAFFNMAIYTGTNRSRILIDGIISLLIIYKLFGKKSKILIITLCIVLALIMVGVTIFRQYVSITNDGNKLIGFTDTLQVYLGGPYNVAIALETKEMFPEASRLRVLLFDIFRPMLGVNFFIKNLPIDYSNVFFNKRIWIGIDRRSQILPMIGQGNLFFGFLFAPIFNILFIRLSYFLYNQLKKSPRIELYYFFSLVLARLGFMMGQNTMNMINYLSINLFLFLIIYSINNMFTKRIVLRKSNIKIN